MSETVDRILTALRTFGERHLNSMLADERRSFGPDVVMDLAELGLFGLQVPRAEGGIELSHRQTVHISMQLGAIDMSLAVMIGMHNGLGLAPILTAALPATRAELVPGLAAGHGLASYALTEIGPGGSNPRGLRTVARAVPGGWLLSGHKIWTGLAPWARVITVIANAVDGDGRPLGTLACLVRRGNPGLRVGDELLTMGVRAMPQNHVHFSDAFIPTGDVLAEPGEGMAVAQRVMQNVRLGIAAMCAGAMQRCAQLAVRYAAHRTVATGPLLENPVTRRRLDWMLHAAAAAEALVNHCADALDAGRPLPEALYATAKVTAPENLATVADWTLQMLGGAGYTETNEVARIVRDARVLRIFEGPTEALEHHLGTQARRETAGLAETLETIAPGRGLGEKLRSAAASAPAGADGRLGRFAAEVLLLAVLAKDEGGRVKDEGRATRTWQEERCAEAEAALSGHVAAPASEDLLRRVQAFTTSVGDLHRTAAGEDHRPHPFMVEHIAPRASGAEPLECAGPPALWQERSDGVGMTPGEATVSPPRLRLPPQSAGGPAHSKSPRSESGASADAFLPLVHDTLLSVLRDQVDGSIAALDPDAPLTRYGMDSLATAEAAVRLERATGRKLAPDLLAQMQTAREVARLLAGEPWHEARAHDGVSLDGEAHGGARHEEEARAERRAPPFAQRMAQAMERIHHLREAGRYPYHTETTETDDGHVTVDGLRLAMMASYEYLSIGGHPKLAAAMQEATARFGTGSHGSMFLGGQTTYHCKLRERIAEVMNAKAALVFTSGYLANVAPIAAMTAPGDVVIGDALNHASIVDGCRLSGARFMSFAHNDPAALERHLAENAGKHMLVVVDGVFSLDGDIANLPAIVPLCRKYGALLMVDEAHAFGAVGKTGRGVQEHFGLPPDAIDLKMGTLSKSLGGIGGFVAGKAAIIDYLRHQARGYLFASALPAPNVAASIAALDVLEQEPWRVERLQANARRWRDGLRAMGYDTFASETPIVPVRMPDETAAFEFAHRCKERGVFVVPVVFPAVPQNAPRLRTCMTAGLTDEDISQALEVFAKVGRELGVIG